MQGAIVGREPEERLSIRRDKNHVLFGGTKILQHTPDKVADSLALTCLTIFEYDIVRRGRSLSC